MRTGSGWPTLYIRTVTDLGYRVEDQKAIVVKAMDPTVELARAKLTVSLKITGTRSDGYHLIDSEMISLDLADRLDIAPGTGLEIVCKYPRSERQDRSNEQMDVVSDGSNLVARALNLVGKSARVRLEKNIPPGAGLGGGSADAAAILRWARVFEPEIALELGADVPFCVAGGRARVSGIGDILEPLAYFDRYFVLLTPPFGVSTKDVYRSYDDLRAPDSGNLNDLEIAALNVEPRLGHWQEELGVLTHQQPVLAGSGSTWFVELFSKEEFDTLKQQTGTLVAEYLSQGVMLTFARSTPPLTYQKLVSSSGLP